MTVTQPTQEWSIGIFRGRSPLQLGAQPGTSNPILTKAQVTDVNAEGVADPFLVRDADGWSLFCEVIDATDGRGKIGLATSADAIHWRYRQVVLAEPFHLSYPYVFEWDGAHYLVPESTRAKSVRLYVARQFPLQWDFVATLLEGPRFADASLFRWNERWWLFAETNAATLHRTLRLFYAERLTGPWIEHRDSPIVPDNGHIARPAGRVIVWQDHPIRFTQDCDPIYGMAVRAFAITTLTPDDYAEKALSPDPVLRGSGRGWNSGGMHHVDAQRLPGGDWLAAVDGWREVED